jgi:hypothetical protein
MTIASFLGSVTGFAIDRPTLWPGGFLSGQKPFGFDATLREDHGVSYAIAGAPLENGARTTDHVQPLPVTITCEAVLANVSARLLTPAFAGQATALYGQLLNIAATRVPFDFEFTLKLYQSLIFRQIGTIRTAESGDALVCTLVMEQIEIATVDQVAVLADAAVAFSLGSQNIGSLTPGTSTTVPVNTGVPLPVV